MNRFWDRAIVVKGPGLRIGLDVRRVWRCAKCGRTVRTAVQVVAQRCGCSEAGNWMVLQPPVKREPFCPPVREPLVDPGAEDAPVTVPVEAAGDETGGAGVPAAEAQGTVVLPDGANPPTQSPNQTSELADALLESLAAVDVPVSPTEGAPNPAAAAEPGGMESESGVAPPDDFGAGLGNG
jgi:hypothetical protein